MSASTAKLTDKPLFGLLPIIASGVRAGASEPCTCSLAGDHNEIFQRDDFEVAVLLSSHWNTLSLLSLRIRCSLTTTRYHAGRRCSHAHVSAGLHEAGTRSVQQNGTSNRQLTLLTCALQMRSRDKIPYVRSFPDDPAAGDRLVILPAEDTASTTRGRPIGREYFDVNEKIAFMSKHGIDVSVISLANPCKELFTLPTAIKNIC